MNAIIFGSTGLVGGLLLELLISKDEYNNIYIVNRKNKQKNNTEKLHYLDFEQFRNLSDISIDHYYCALGTTIKKAKSKEAFYKVDHDLVVETLKRSKALGTSKHVIVSALGVSESSPIFYNKVKAKMERSAKEIDHDVIIVRPSLIEGDRDEHRTLESLGLLAMKGLNHLLMGPLKKYRSIKAGDIALAMYELIMRNDTSVAIEYES